MQCASKPVNTGVIHANNERYRGKGLLRQRHRHLPGDIRWATLDSADVIFPLRDQHFGQILKDAACAAQRIRRPFQTLVFRLALCIGEMAISLVVAQRCCN